MALQDTYTQRVAKVESSNNPRAKAKTSSATGLYQFIDQTWLETVDKHEPTLRDGRTPQQLLDLRMDPDVSTRMFERFTDDNARFLTKNGIEPSPANLYLAHFLGAGGARKLLKTDAGRRLDMAGFKWVLNANPGVASAGGTVGDLIAWAERKMDGAAAYGRQPSEIQVTEAKEAPIPSPKPRLG